MSSNKEWLSRLKSIECPDATYFAEENPLVLEKGAGSEVWDHEGKRYIDFCAGFGVMALGHNHPEIRKIHDESDLLVHGMGDVYPSTAKIQLMENIIKKLPSFLSHGAFSVTGSQAVEMAMKTAILHTGKSGFIALRGSYHGLDFGSLAVTHREDFRQPFLNWLNESQVEFVSPQCPLSELNDAIERLRSRGCGFAGIIAEPIMGRAGIHPLSIEFLEELRIACTDNDALLIFDEIFCGYGRTGKFSFAEIVKCDMTCLGKPMGGGLPLSGVFSTEKVMNAWPQSKGEATHTGTFFGHALACRYGLAVLEIMARQSLLTEVVRKGKLIRDLLSSTDDQQLEIRGDGLMLCIDFKSAGKGASAMNQLREKGLIVLAAGSRGESICLSPPYNIPDELLREGAELLNSFITELP